MKRARGFTLIEVLVAFALLAGASVLLLGLLANGLRATARAEHVNEAVAHARNLLDNAGRAERLRPGVQGGELDGGRFRWQLRVEPLEAPWPEAALPPGGDPGLVLEGIVEPVVHAVELRIEWGRGGPAERLHARTLRAAYPLPEER